MNLSKYLYTVTIFIFLFEIYVLLKIVTITTAPILAGSVRNFKILALFEPLFSFQLFIRYRVLSIEPVCLVLQLRLSSVAQFCSVLVMHAFFALPFDLNS